MGGEHGVVGARGRDGRVTVSVAAGGRPKIPEGRRAKRAQGHPCCSDDGHAPRYLTQYRPGLPCNRSGARRARTVTQARDPTSSSNTAERAIANARTVILVAPFLSGSVACVVFPG